ncbi:MAG: 2-hydroxyacyl-CoA dehydratase family protein [candidate division WOR-3 bacterium]
MKPNLWQDPLPARITFDEWAELFETVPDELIQSFRYFRRPDESESPRVHSDTSNHWSQYLFPPQTFAIYGCRHLRRLKFDNSLAALRLWGFVQNETERLFRARQIGRHVIATMGDLGAVPVIVNSFPDCIAFYPDCSWWTPFVMESKVLLETAAELGIGEATCFSRAALAAFARRAYFPVPEMVIAATGASCDDYSGVEQLVADIARELLWVELPLRRLGTCQTFTGMVYEAQARELLVSEFRRVVERLEHLTGCRVTDEELGRSIRRTNRLRRMVMELRRLAYGDGVLPALEMMVVEFGNLHCYSDPDEWERVVEHLLQTARQRRQANRRVVLEDALRLVWVTPPADPLLLTFVEDRGARLVGTEYVINQALEPIDEEKEPLTAIAESFMAASLIGTSRQRSELIIQQLYANRAEGVVISGILGGSHCAMEARLIADRVKAETGLPVLEFDVAPPAREIDRQLATRIEAFLELLRDKR